MDEELLEAARNNAAMPTAPVTTVEEIPKFKIAPAPRKTSAKPTAPAVATDEVLTAAQNTEMDQFVPSAAVVSSVPEIIVDEQSTSHSVPSTACSRGLKRRIAPDTDGKLNYTLKTAIQLRVEYGVWLQREVNWYRGESTFVVIYSKL